MGSKARPLNGDHPSGLAEEDVSGRPSPLGRPAAARLLDRIADALQVPPAVLYNPPDAVTATPRVAGNPALDTELDRECAALLSAYGRIQDPSERQRLLALVQEAAGEPNR
jgi:hypothetical protein